MKGSHTSSTPDVRPEILLTEPGDVILVAMRRNYNVERRPSKIGLYLLDEVMIAELTLALRVIPTVDEDAPLAVIRPHP